MATLSWLNYKTPLLDKDNTAGVNKKGKKKKDWREATSNPEDKR